ncbi:helix-turn-helix transcriptional regulator [Bifidobacterium sp. UTCIF-24]|uniref:helix-turn-helix domain-containing protein n=1 Tax=Bifidobacterium sp. UTCIF-24 TaxID=1465256 RepID=UPI0011273C40|nr:helix-turn-helix transcriptional regulator [Bifidobacterium sp. UTCIF-24]TPF79344.1 hypothetical protein BW08_10600 [Bifidobacterium sp. UTCIF-24]
MTTRNVNQIDATGKQVAANVARLRGGMQYKELAEKLTELGRPITPMGLKRIESGERKVDVDDLMALAVAFDVSPLTLLLPEGGSRDVPAMATGCDHELGSNVLWLWACGEEPIKLPADAQAAHDHPDTDRAVAEYRMRAKPAIDARLGGGAVAVPARKLLDAVNNYLKEHPEDTKNVYARDAVAEQRYEQELEKQGIAYSSRQVK